MVLAAGVRTKVDILISWTFYLVESYNDIMIIIISLLIILDLHNLILSRIIFLDFYNIMWSRMSHSNIILTNSLFI